MKTYQKIVEQERVVKQLEKISVEPPSKRHLLQSSLAKLDGPNYQYQAPIGRSSRKSAYSRLVFYIPTAVAGLLLVAWVASPILSSPNQAITSSNVATNPNTRPNGSIQNATNAIAAEAASESQVDEQAISETLSAANQIVDQANLVVEVSDEKGL